MTIDNRYYKHKSHLGTWQWVIRKWGGAVPTFIFFLQGPVLKFGDFRGNLYHQKGTFRPMGSRGVLYQPLAPLRPLTFVGAPTNIPTPIDKK